MCRCLACNYTVHALCSWNDDGIGKPIKPKKRKLIKLQRKNIEEWRLYWLHHSRRVRLWMTSWGRNRLTVTNIDHVIWRVGCAYRTACLCLSKVYACAWWQPMRTPPTALTTWVASISDLAALTAAWRFLSRPLRYVTSGRWPSQRYLWSVATVSIVTKRRVA